MSDGYLSIAEARERGGLRLVVIRGVPSPWTQAAKGILHVKGIDYAKVELAPGEPREALREWTGQDSFPAAMYEDERPRAGWEEILWLAERLAPSPGLVPSDPAERVTMFGLSREICGELGLGWCRRLLAMGSAMKDGASPAMAAMGHKYLSSEEETALALDRVVEILGLLTARLEESKRAGHRYLMGESLTALDIYWATFCNLLKPLPPDQLPLAPGIEKMFEAREPRIVDALDPSLLEHRDFIYQTHLELPVEV
ncbi:MAG TPA: hypothetical protein VKA74_17285 [Myxococcota bacterium]|nr:hypothetical protein [Myxococcota bacterium]